MRRFLRTAVFLSITIALASTSEGQSLFGGGTNTGGGNRTGGGTGIGGPAGASDPTSVSSDAGTVTGGERFLRENRTAGQFVGSDSQELSNSFIGALGGMNSASAGAAAGGRQIGGAGANQNRGQQRNNNSRRTINYAMKLSIGFQFDGLPRSQVDKRMQSMFSNVMKNRKLSDVRVTLQDRTAILQGTVPNSDEKKLLGRLIELEPGVSNVKNDLVVVAAPPRPAPALEVIPPAG